MQFQQGILLSIRTCHPHLICGFLCQYDLPEHLGSRHGWLFDGKCLVCESQVNAPGPLRPSSAFTLAQCARLPWNSFVSVYRLRGHSDVVLAGVSHAGWRPGPWREVFSARLGHRLPSRALKDQMHHDRKTSPSTWRGTRGPQTLSRARSS